MNVELLPFSFQQSKKPLSTNIHIIIFILKFDFTILIDKIVQIGPNPTRLRDKVCYKLEKQNKPKSEFDPKIK